MLRPAVNSAATSRLLRCAVQSLSRPRGGAACFTSLVENNGRTPQVERWLAQYPPHLQDILEFEYIHGYRKGPMHEGAPALPRSIGKQIVAERAKTDKVFAAKLRKMSPGEKRKAQWWEANKATAIPEQRRQAARRIEESFLEWFLGSKPAPALLEQISPANQLPRPWRQLSQSLATAIEDGQLKMEGRETFTKRARYIAYQQKSERLLPSHTASKAKRERLHEKPVRPIKETAQRRLLGKSSH